jgi:hypothetical protein
MVLNTLVMSSLVCLAPWSFFTISWTNIKFSCRQQGPSGRHCGTSEPYVAAQKLVSSLQGIHEFARGFYDIIISMICYRVFSKRGYELASLKQNSCW